MWKEYIDKIPNYRNLDVPQFLQLDFLKCFYANNQFIRHIFLKKDNSILYANIFLLQFKKGLQYNKSNFLTKCFLRLINLKICFLGNWYLNNFKFFDFKDRFDISDFFEVIKERYSAMVVPDYLMNILSNKEKIDFIKVEIEEDMIFKVDPSWTSYNDYIDCLKTKYKRKIEEIDLNSKSVKIKLLNKSDLNLYKQKMQSLFNQVVNNTKFSGPQFNVETLLSLSEKKYVSIYGYFEKNNLIAFSSYFKNSDDLISYYVGFDKKLNKTLPIYPKILFETIKIAIKGKYKKIIFGRTANEFKSNFGAVPIKSYIFVNFKNKIIHFLFKRILKNNEIKLWNQRSPYKIQ